jgi:hypothetical protein
MTGIAKELICMTKRLGLFNSPKEPPADELITSIKDITQYIRELESENRLLRDQQSPFSSPRAHLWSGNRLPQYWKRTGFSDGTWFNVHNT